ncbi:nicotinate-nucleotide diphosphorylase (carboxylating), partial [Bdellovibrionales bacterium]|nr:nicotinate-nucleotide diphosphorylase (carboxylating) [Bdellovibrionales bacterium]
LSGGISQAIHQIRQRSTLPIEVETTDLIEVAEAVKNKVERILLDNMTNEQLTEAVKIIPDSIESEASGNMSVERVRSVAEIGVNSISVGSITHSAPSADLSLLFDWNTKS